MSIALPTAAQTAAAPDPFALKLVIVGRRKPGTLLSEHRHHIRRVHGELVLGYIASEPASAPRRYVQNTVFDGQYRAGAAASDPFALNRDFVTQIWFPDAAALGRSLETAYYRDKLKGDEDNFVDQQTVVFMPTRERELHRRAGAAAGIPTPGPGQPRACKLMGFVQRAAGADADAFARAWSAAAVTARPAFAKVARHVQNDVLAKPGTTSPADAIDEFWVDDEAAARALAADWHAWVGDALVRPGLATAGSAFALLLHEDVLHAGTR